MAFPIQESDGFPTRFQYGAVQGGHPLTGSADAIGFGTKGQIPLVGGTYYINTAGVDAITLIAPVSGSGFGGGSGGTFPNLAGQDDLVVLFMSTTANAHTITTPSNAINGSLHIATFGAAVGNNITFIAQKGVWYVVGTPKGVTLS